MALRPRFASSRRSAPAVALLASLVFMLVAGASCRSSVPANAALNPSGTSWWCHRVEGGKHALSRCLRSEEDCSASARENYPDDPSLTCREQSSAVCMTARRVVTSVEFPACYSEVSDCEFWREQYFSDTALSKDYTDVSDCTIWGGNGGPESVRTVSTESREPDESLRPAGGAWDCVDLEFLDGKSSMCFRSGGNECRSAADAVRAANSKDVRAGECKVMPFAYCLTATVDGTPSLRCHQVGIDCVRMRESLAKKAEVADISQCAQWR